MLGIVEHLTTILLSGYANDRQLKTLFNYLIHSGKALRLGKFIREVAQRVPQHKEKLMTIAERLREVGRRQGSGKVAGKGDWRALRRGSAPKRGVLLKRCSPKVWPETVLRITGLSEADIRAVTH